MDGIGFVGVMPVVEVGGSDDAMEWTQPPPDVGVEKEAKDDLSNSDRTRHIGREAGRDKEQDRWTDEHPVEWMNADAAQPIEVLARVMHRMEAPQPCVLVGEAVHPVPGKVEEHRTDEGEGRVRKHGHKWSKCKTRKPGQAHHPSDGGHDEANAGDEWCCQCEREVSAQTRAA